MFYKIHIITHSRSLYYQCLTNPTEVFEQNLEGKTRSENKKYLPLWLCWEVNSKYCSLFLRSENWNPNPVSKFKVKPLFKKWNFTKKSKQGSSNFCNVLKISARFVKFLQCLFSGQFDDPSFWQIMSKICNRIISSSVSEL